MNKWSCAVAGQSPDPSIITVLQLCLSPKGPEFKGTRDPQSQLGAEARISELQQEGDPRKLWGGFMSPPSGRSPPRDNWEVLVWRREHCLRTTASPWDARVQEETTAWLRRKTLGSSQSPANSLLGLFLRARWASDSPVCCLFQCMTFYVWPADSSCPKYHFH